MSRLWASGSRGQCLPPGTRESMDAPEPRVQELPAGDLVLTDTPGPAGRLPRAAGLRGLRRGWNWGWSWPGSGVTVTELPREPGAIVLVLGQSEHRSVLSPLQGTRQGHATRKPRLRFSPCLPGRRKK